MQPKISTLDIIVCLNEDCSDWDSEANTLCIECIDAGWVLDIENNPVEPMPRKQGDKYYSGYPLYRCQHCGIRGGH